MLERLLSGHVRMRFAGILAKAHLAVPELIRVDSPLWLQSKRQMFVIRSHSNRAQAKGTGGAMSPRHDKRGYGTNSLGYSSAT
jgi:hypothetical protein